MTTYQLLTGDCLEVLRTLPAASVHCVITSPPYYRLRNYGVTGQIGLEKTPAAYVAQLVAVFREVRRVLRDDGTLWINLGDSNTYSATSLWTIACARSLRFAKNCRRGFRDVIRHLCEQYLVESRSGAKTLPQPGQVRVISCLIAAFLHSREQYFTFRCAARRV